MEVQARNLDLDAFLGIDDQKQQTGNDGHASRKIDQKLVKDLKRQLSVENEKIKNHGTTEWIRKQN